MLSLLILVDHLCAIIRNALDHVEVLVLWVPPDGVEEDAETSVLGSVLLLTNIFQLIEDKDVDAFTALPSVVLVVDDELHVDDPSLEAQSLGGLDDATTSWHLRVQHEAVLREGGGSLQQPVVLDHLCHEVGLPRSAGSINYMCFTLKKSPVNCA